MPLPNTYAGRCNTCGTWVPAREGKTEQVNVGRSTVWPTWCATHPTAREQITARHAEAERLAQVQALVDARPADEAA